MFREFLILFRILFFFIGSEQYIKQAEVIGLRLLVTRIQFPASRPRLPGFGCCSSSVPTPAGHWPLTPPSRPQWLRIVLPTEERVPVPAPRCPQGGCPASRRSAGYNTRPDDAPSNRFADAGHKCRWGVLLRAVSKHPADNSHPALCKCRPAAQITISYVILPFAILPASTPSIPQQNKAHLPFDYSLTKPKGRCECANFQNAGSVRYYNRLGQNTIRLYFGLTGVIPCICNRPLPCIHKKCSELLLCGHTFYNELCK